ncbi:MULTISPECIES: hypothetical protein [Halomonadaceae]|uniref:Uncharacterized protein n=1 Tax=Vreelandella titanicae TaxID=664683 RepID=A0A653W391_9GAMM|nr:MULTISPECIES: hypothetical protein [Halomonas]QKS24816.1 hypothetical protein FX987_02599 [Halomonas titanicae]CAD5252140.1 conserved hypothetical protein [Halomonas sp. 113]CAD5252211.1 conserved hypothetical protein [Halomonas sp. 59]CAD5259681.1 conserved hypothetical protein [Halomonas sp. I3]CAD5295521.1 conserved hypothetical protein [Halomonas sp. 156]
MDKQHDHIESKQISNRPRWLTLCMMATAASVIVLAGCGDNEETAPPAEESSPLEQDATTQPEPGMSEESAMEQDPGLSEEPAAENSMTQSEETMAEDPMPEESMPDDTMDEPAEGTMNPDDEPGFGEGTEPMPGAEEEDENSTSN